MANRLAGSTSPYLVQHKDNPVDWWEWGEEAFAQARLRDVPVLLSVGYAACHWCHVMAHESFSDPATAELMNAHFVNVKVDREERPDVDAVYMGATQAMTGQGGWPMTVFLTPSGQPFFAGTYFPPRPRRGAPAFTEVLEAVARTWREQRAEVDSAGERIARVLGGRQQPPGALPAEEAVRAAVRSLVGEEDREHGGFGTAPKFPPAMDVEFLLRHAARQRLGGTGPDGRPEEAAFEAGTGRAALDTAARTLRAMAHSGMYDQVAGGFARYAVDRAWVVPHFEKMLTDNALLALAYLHWWRLTGEPTGARVALETCDWMLAALRTPEGGLSSSLDADTPVDGPDGVPHAVEGLTYVWTPQELVQVLGADDGEWAAELLRVSAVGSFEHGTSTLQLARDVWAEPGQAERWRSVRARLAQARAGRPQPGRDDKVVAAWNGLAITALAETGALLERPDLVAAAREAAALLLRVHLLPAGQGAGVRLRRVSRDGRVGAPAGVLEDYGDVAAGLLTLHGVTGEPRWLEAAGLLLEVVLGPFADPRGGFFDTSAEDTDAALAAVRRPQDPTDSAYPSGASAVAGALLGYAAATGSSRHREAAEAALGPAAGAGASAPRAFGWGLAVAEAWLDGPREVALVDPGVDAAAPPPAVPPGGRAGPNPVAAVDPAAARLHRVALLGTAPGLVIAVGGTDAPGVPLLAGRPPVGGRAAGYVCRGFVCDVPVTADAALAAAVGAVLALGGGAGGR